MRLHHVGGRRREHRNHCCALQALLGVRVSSRAGHVLLKGESTAIALVPRRPDDPPARAYGEHLAFSVGKKERARLDAVCEQLRLEAQRLEHRSDVRLDDGLLLEFVFE